MSVSLGSYMKSSLRIKSDPMHLHSEDLLQVLAISNSKTQLAGDTVSQRPVWEKKWGWVLVFRHNTRFSFMHLINMKVPGVVLGARPTAAN